MRLVVQRVRSASVKVVSESGIEELEVGSTCGNPGLLVLVGLHYKHDIEPVDVFSEKANRLALKLCKLKFFDATESLPSSFSPSSSSSSSSSSCTPSLKWKRSLRDDPQLKLLLISQFTLFANHQKGGKLDFHQAMPASLAKERFNIFVDKCRALLNINNHKNDNGDGKDLGDRVATGAFGERMRIDAILDGPVTVLIESNEIDDVETN